jgi:flagellar hook protein FlgE
MSLSLSDAGDGRSSFPLISNVMSVALIAAGAPATSSTLINDLDVVTEAYEAGDRISIQGQDISGGDIDVTLQVSGTTTVGQLVSAISSAFPGANAALALC